MATRHNGVRHAGLRRDETETDTVVAQSLGQHLGRDGAARGVESADRVRAVMARDAGVVRERHRARRWPVRARSRPKLHREALDRVGRE